jgi:perosamine synthetase
MHKDSDRIDWFRPEMTGSEEQQVIKVLRSGFVNDGPVTREFEKRIAELVEVKHCVAVTSGTAAISLALMAAGIGRDDEVLVPDLTFIATANAVRMTGATVRLVDIEPLRFGIDAEKLRSTIGPRTRAVVSVDINGRGADYRVIEPFCRDHGLRLITDSAEGLGSRFNGRPLGSFGDAGCFSFSPNKLVTTGQGGMVATNDDVLHEHLLELKDQGRRCRGTGGDDLHPVLGFNFKFTDIQAAVGLAQLDQLEERKKRAELRDVWYRHEMSALPGITFPGGEKEEDGEIRAWTDILARDRDLLRRALEASRIGCRAFWFPLHSQNPYKVTDGDFEVSSRVSAQGLWLPSTFDISCDTVMKICQRIKTVIQTV